MATILTNKITKPLSALYPTGAVSDKAEQLVEDKYNQTIDYADQALEMSTGFIEDIQNFLNGLSLKDIANTRYVKEVIAPPEDLTALLEGIPESLITQSDFDDIKVPSALSWVYTEDPYDTDFLNHLKSRLEYIIRYGGDALNEVVTDLYDQETEKNVLANEDAKTQVAENWSKRNFEFPSLGLFNQMSQVDTEYQNKMLDKARDIRIESRKTEIQMEQFAMDTGAKVEGITEEYWTNHNRLKLDAAKNTIDYGLAILNAALEKLRLKAAVYGEEVRAYAAKIGVSQAIASMYLANIEAKVKQNIQEAQVSLSDLDANIRYFTAQSGLVGESLKGLLTVSAQIAASSLAAFNAGASIQGSFQSQVGASTQISESYSNSNAISD